VIDSLFTGPHKVWTEKDSLEDFFARRSNMSSSVRFEAWLTVGLNDDEYADLIVDMDTELVNMVCAVDFQAWDGDVAIYMNNIRAHDPPSKITKERVLEEIAHCRRSDATLKRLDAKKAEKGVQAEEQAEE
ncbi:MAG: hypothetical protein LBU07_01815, partial [Coriobacteriales bacterium]|jgi:hypothetical protein|nr:hypothetical protein [Coriobacteriales bacterium]